ncbi:DUF1016 domain-containing protein [Pseudomonas sp. SAICEU22]|uniref:DUF1016 domain-containing protein n=1 Tax=Pseudomonas agronomica TaxID=2979328 RepID=A0ABT3FET9_9PSED|nr:DUF1016 domain-containing protein [Pseudomonas agronomica]MCW1247329.1 DUF1016 domain-containing protein [Pseudomonas agronomica]
MSEITRTSDYRQALANIKRHIQSSQKAGAFKPEYIGKLNFYLSAVDDQSRAVHDQPTIGLLLCKDKDKRNVICALRDKPMGVSLSITKDIPLAVQLQLPTVKEIESELAQGHGEPPSYD